MKNISKGTMVVILLLCMILPIFSSKVFNSLSESENTEDAEMNEEEVSSDVAPPDYIEENTFIDTETFRIASQEPSKKVLLVEDVLPWRSTANQVVLGSIAEYQKVTTSQFLTIDLSEYSVIVFANDQPFSSYGNYIEFKEYMELFASMGGVIVFGACDAGWAQGSLIEKLPGDVSKRTRYELRNYISDDSHPIVTASLSDNIALLDGDLTGSYCSHVSFDEESLPAGSKVILREESSDRPTLVEYPLGKGRVIASGLTWEFAYTRAGQSGLYGRVGHYAQKAMDDMFRYAIRVSSIDVNDLSALKEYYADKNAHHIVVADKETTKPIENAEVSINGKIYASDENGMVSHSEFFGAHTIRVTAPNYRTNKEYYNIQPRTSRIIFMESSKNDNLPYITMVTDINLSFDLRSQTRRVTEGDATMVRISADGDWNSNTIGYYVLYQDSINGGLAGKSIVKKYGDFNFAPGKDFNPEQNVKLKMVSANGVESEPIIINLRISKKTPISEQFNNTYNRSDDSMEFQLLKDANASSGSVDFQKLFPLDFSLKCDAVPVELSCSQTADGYTVRGLIGLRSTQETKSLITGKEETKYRNFVQDVKNANTELFNQAKFDDKFLDPKLRSGFELSHKMVGYIDIKLDKEGNIVSSKGGLLVEGKYEEKFGDTFFYGPVPVYYELKLGAGFKFGPSLQFYSTDNGFGFNPDLSLKLIIPKISLGGGVGVYGVATVGIEGGAELETGVTLDAKGFDVKGAIEAYGAVKIKVLFVTDFQWKFAKVKLQLYPDTGVLGTRSLPNGNSQPELTLASRDYNSKTTEWGNANNNFRTMNAKAANIASLQDWILPDSIPKISKVGDNLIMIFQADDATKPLGDNIVLMYSVYDNNTWSEPKPVWGTGTSDMFFEQVVSDDELYVVWQKQKTTVTETDVDKLLSEVARNSEIAFAKYNKSTGLFEQQTYITDNDIMDMYPEIAVNGNEISVVWASDSSSDPLKAEGTYSIMKSVLKDDKIGNAEKLYETDKQIMEIAAGYSDNALKVAFSIQDGTNPNVYVIDGNTTNLSYGKVGSAITFKYGSFFWQSEGTIYRYDLTNKTVDKISADEGKTITSSYKVLRTNDKTAIVWIDVDGETYSIKASFFNGKWSAPVTLLSADDYKIQYMDVILLESGKWQIAMNTFDAAGMSSLKFADINTKADIELSSVYVNELDKMGEMQPVLYSVTNLGENVVNSFRVRIANSNFTFTDKTISCSIAPGETVDFTEEIDVTNINSVTDFKILVESENESDLSNNEGDFKLGLVDVSIDLTKYMIGEKIIVMAQVKNESKTPANTAISVVEDNLNGIVLDMKNIGVLDNTQDYVYIYSIDTNEINFGVDNNKVYHFKVDTLEPNLNVTDSDLVIAYPAIAENVGNEPLIEIDITHVTGVFLDKKNIHLTISGDSKESAQLFASVNPQNATHKDVMWTVEDADVAYVDTKGVVTARRVGQTKVIATTYDGEFVDEAIVSVGLDTDKYQLTVTSGNGGSIISTTGGEYPFGANVEIFAQADNGYKFKNWTTSNGGTFEDANTIRTTFTMPKNATTIVANFEKIDTGSGGSGSGGSGSTGSGSTGSGGSGSGNSSSNNSGSNSSGSTGGSAAPSRPSGNSSGNTSSYIVTFNTNGGSTLTGKSVTSGNKVAKPNNPVKLGFDFAGWYTDERLTTQYDFEKAVTANITLYAKWSEANNTNTAWKNPFIDVKTSDWFYKNVEYVHTNGLFAGTSANTFDPQMQMTRGMIVTVLWRLAGEPNAGNSSFSDIPTGAYYEKATAWAAQMGIVNGIGDNKFAPDANITRQDLCVILYNYSSKMNISINQTLQNVTFADADKIADYATNAVSNVARAGIVNGKGDGIFDPRANATRAEVAAMLNRFAISVK